MGITTFNICIKCEKIEVITFVRGRVPSTKMEEFKAGYKSLKEQPKPQGFIASYLLQDTHDDEICMIKRSWRVKML